MRTRSLSPIRRWSSMPSPWCLALALTLAPACTTSATCTVEPSVLRPTRHLRGVVLPAAGVAHIAAPHSSSVRSLAVQLGDHVEEGALLGELTAGSSLLLEDIAPVVAPRAGTVVAVNVAVGDSVGPGMPLFEVADLVPRVVRIEAEHEALEGVQAPASAHVRQGALHFDAQLERIAVERSVDPIRGVEGHWVFTLDVPPELDLAAFTEVDVDVDAQPVEAAFSLPRSAILFEEGQAWVCSADVWGTRHPVTLGATDDARVQLIDADALGTLAENGRACE